MGAGEILCNTFSLLRAQFKTYMGSVAISMVLTFVSLLFVLLCMSFGYDATIFGLVVASVFDCVVVNVILYGAITKIASEQFNGEIISPGEAWRFAFGKTWPLLLSAILVLILGTIGLMVLIIPGICIFISFALIFQTVIIEDCPPGKSLLRSNALIKDSWGKCVSVLFLVVIIQFVLTALVSGLISLAFSVVGLGRVLNEIANLIVVYMFAPVSAIATTLLYYDLREQKEDENAPVVADSQTDNNMPLSGQ